MNTEERKLITDLFDRMRGMRGIEKDADAANLIEREAAANSDAVYMLTQSVLVQEQALQKANERIQELEAAGQSQAQNGSDVSAQPRRSAGFGQPSSTSVPAAGAPTTSSGMVPNISRQANRQNEINRGLGGGFMGQAMTTAAGVAGGMLLANGISSLFSGSSASASETSTAEATPASDQSPATEDAAPADDGNLQNASSDGGDDSWFGGDDGWGDFGGDFEL